MNIETLRKRLKRDRPMTTITIRMPEDVIEDLKRIAPLLGFSGYQPLVRAYVGQGLRLDLERLADDRVALVVESLQRQGVSPAAIEAALAEVAARDGSPS
jgi:predicted transcriptional regulator